VEAQLLALLESVSEPDSPPTQYLSKLSEDDEELDKDELYDELELEELDEELAML
jgi:hypothetical protein